MMMQFIIYYFVAARGEAMHSAVRALSFCLSEINANSSGERRANERYLRYY